ncbi:unnamed protein product [Oncorhynchus mykiss]|uniref:Secreted protein n=1 Tax=Oncorhynchus mykiss TaxID=8022 RepID=A0A060YT47_ONCMY|nr:unnamed protein product [Oncorhynchus mykiss]
MGIVVTMAFSVSATAVLSEVWSKEWKTLLLSLQVGQSSCLRPITSSDPKQQCEMCMFSLCVCVCVPSLSYRWRERGLHFWSGSRQTHETGPYSKFRTDPVESGWGRWNPFHSESPTRALISLPLDLNP